MIAPNQSFLDYNPLQNALQKRSSPNKGDKRSVQYVKITHLEELEVVYSLNKGDRTERSSTLSRVPQKRERKSSDDSN